VIYYKGFVNYRDCTLTRVLQDSFGGNSATALIITCSPGVEHVKKTLNTLRFGTSASTIVHDVYYHTHKKKTRLQVRYTRLHKSAAGTLYQYVHVHTIVLCL
jgi:hypothetical protein